MAKGLFFLFFFISMIEKQLFVSTAYAVALELVIYITIFLVFFFFFSFFAVFSLSCFSLSFALNVASTSPLFLAVDMQIIVLLLYLNILHNCKKNMAEIQKIVVL